MEAKENRDTIAELLGFRNELKPDRWEVAEQRFEQAVRLRQHIADLLPFSPAKNNCRISAGNSSQRGGIRISFREQQQLKYCY